MLRPQGYHLFNTKDNDNLILCKGERAKGQAHIKSDNVPFYSL